MGDASNNILYLCRKFSLNAAFFKDVPSCFVVRRRGSRNSRLCRAKNGSQLRFCPSAILNNLLRSPSLSHTSTWQVRSLFEIDAGAPVSSSCPSVLRNSISGFRQPPLRTQRWYSDKKFSIPGLNVHYESLLLTPSNPTSDFFQPFLACRIPVE